MFVFTLGSRSDSAVSPSAHLLLTTTDTRMAKPKHLAHDPTVEIAWWIEAPAIQFRITGEGHVIPPAGSSSTSEILRQLGATGEVSMRGAEWRRDSELMSRRAVRSGGRRSGWSCGRARCRAIYERVSHDHLQG